MTQLSKPPHRSPLPPVFSQDLSGDCLHTQPTQPVPYDEGLAGGSGNSQPLSPLTPPKIPVFGRLVEVDKTKSISKDGKSVELRTTGMCSVGRSSKSELKVDDAVVSSTHCMIGYAEKISVPFIEDHKSSNGTFVNGVKIDGRVYLAHGDVVSLVAPPEWLCVQPNDVLISPGSNKRAKPNFPPNVGYSMRFEAIPAPVVLVEREQAPKDFSSHFVIEAELGKGNFAIVYRALDRSTGERVAVKVIKREKFMKISEARWLQQVKEAEVLRKLNHPNIVTFRRLFQYTTALFVVTEYLEGGELYNRLVEHGAYKEDRAKLMMLKIVEAVAYLHDNGIVHRDLKPENIVLKNRNNDVDVKLVDFGVAAETSAGRKTFCGSMSYVAPEVLRRQSSFLKQGTYGKEVDMWSIGVIVHVVLTLKPPFDEDDEAMHSTIGEVLRFNLNEWRGISDHAKDFVARCLEVNESKRLTARQALEHQWLRM